MLAIGNRGPIRDGRIQTVSSKNNRTGWRHRLLALVGLWRGRRRDRRLFARELPSMPDEMLADFGLTREEARQACRRPFWRA